MQAHDGPDRPCLVSGDGTVHTFRDVNRRVNRLARALRASGIERFDRIGILATDSVDYMVVLMASLKIGTTYVPFNYRLGGQRDRGCSRGRTARCVLHHRALRRARRARPPSMPRPQVLASFDGFGRPAHHRRPRRGHHRRLATSRSAPNRGHRLDHVHERHDRATEGRDAVDADDGHSTANALIDFDLGRDEFRYTASPMFHVAGMGCVYYGLARGFCSLILDQYDPAALLHWMQRR